MALVALLGIGAAFACVVVVAGKRVLTTKPRLRKTVALAGLLFAAAALVLVAGSRLFGSMNLPLFGIVYLGATAAMFAAASFCFTVLWHWKALPIPFALTGAGWFILAGEHDPTGYASLAYFVVETVFLAAGVFASVGALFVLRPQHDQDG